MQREQKQKFLRDNVDPDAYEQFMEFCEKEAGEIDIDAWSFEYICQICRRFKESQLKQQQEEENSPHETSFVNYQTANLENAYELSQQIIKEAAEENQNQNHNMKKHQPERKVEQAPVKQEPVKHKQDPGKYTQEPVKPAQEQSALDLLDSIFDKSEKQEEMVQEDVPDQKHFKTMQPSFFDTNDFWGKKEQPKKKARNTADFSVWNQSLSNISIQQQQQSPPSTRSQQNKFRTSVNLYPNKTPKAKESQIPLDLNLNFPTNQAPLNEAVDEKKKSPYLKKPVQETNHFEDLKPSAKKGIKIREIKEIAKGDAPPEKPRRVTKNGFMDTVSCYRSTERSQIKADLSVVIQKHEIVQRSFFSADYPMFYLKIVPLNNVVKRNYEDFSKLRTFLGRVYPGIQLPFLEKAGWFGETNIESIKKQKTQLQFFMKDLIKNSEIRNSRVMEDFLTINEHKPMKRKFEEYERMEKFRGIEDLCLLDGKVDVCIDDESNNYHEKLQFFVSKIEEYLDRFKKLLQNLSHYYAQVASTLSALSKLSVSIAQETKRFNTNVTFNEINNLDKIFRDIKKSYDQQCSHATFKFQIINRKISPFVRYQSENVSTIKQLLHIQHQFKKSYLKRSQHQKAGSSIPYKSDTLKPFKTGVFQESKNILVMKYQTGYINNQVCKQAKRMFQLMASNFKDHWHYQSSKYSLKLEKDLGYWKELKLATA